MPIRTRGNQTTGSDAERADGETPGNGWVTCINASETVSVAIRAAILGGRRQPLQVAAKTYQGRERNEEFERCAEP